MDNVHYLRNILVNGADNLSSSGSRVHCFAPSSQWGLALERSSASKPGGLRLWAALRRDGTPQLRSRRHVDGVRRGWVSFLGPSSPRLELGCDISARLELWPVTGTKQPQTSTASCKTWLKESNAARTRAPVDEPRRNEHWAPAWTPPLTQCERASMWRFKQWRGWKRAPGAVSTDVERSVFATAVIARRALVPGRIRLV